MLKKIILIYLFIFSLSFSEFTKANISIVANIDDKIITNHDLKKEGD